jgi:uncharacterized protein (UPF0261 family)
MKLPISKKLTTGCGLTLAILAVNIGLPSQNALRLTEANNSVVTLLQPQQPDSIDSLITEKLPQDNLYLRFLLPVCGYAYWRWFCSPSFRQRYL